MSGKVLYFSVRLTLGSLPYLFLDALLLLVLGVLLAGVPVFLRKSLSLYSNAPMSVRETVYRWTSDVYECGISGTSTGSEMSLVGDMGLGMVRLLSYVYLFLLLDLEAGVMLIGFYGGCLPAYLVLFLFCVMLSLGCELSKDPLC
jgi:hypothetical protein